MKFRRTTGLVASLLLLAGSGGATTRAVFVESPAALPAALAAAQPGDILTLKDGEWIDAKIVVTKGGEPGNPVEIRAQSPGGVILRGASLLALNAPYVTVDGLLFHRGAITRDSVIQFNSHNGIVRETAVVDYNPASFDTKYYWVFFHGDDNLVDHCYFKGKNHLDPVIGNDLDGSRRNRVARSFFRDMPYASANGREIIRVWGSGKYEGKPDDGAFFTIEGNLFDHADGEGAEIISLKSNHNQVLNNTIVATLGGINIRRGNFNVIRGNIILGQGRAGAMGYRMSGEHNLVQGNFASGCAYGINVSCGEFIGEALTPGYEPNVKSRGVKKAGSVVPTYPQNRDVTIEGNVMVGNAGPDLNFGSSFKNHWPASQQVLLPEQCIVRNNRFVRPQGGASIIGTLPETTPPLNRFKFLPSRFSGNVLVGGENAYAPATAGCELQKLPGGWSSSQESTGFVPLTPNDVGPAWVIARRQAGTLQLESGGKSDLSSPGQNPPHQPAAGK
jgi:poly(beta-D-mannuronate) lyase